MSDIDQRAEKIFSFYNMSARKQHVAFCNACVFFEPGERICADNDMILKVMP